MYDNDFEKLAEFFRIVGRRGTIYAEHDEIWLYPEPAVWPQDLSPFNQGRLEALRFRWDAANEGWSKFV